MKELVCTTVFIIESPLQRAEFFDWRPDVNIAFHNLCEKYNADPKHNTSPESPAIVATARVKTEDDFFSFIADYLVYSKAKK